MSFVAHGRGLTDGRWGQGKNALGRYAQAEDVAKLAAFLVSDDASFITGESWRIPHTHVLVLNLGPRLSTPVAW